jgi:hypothetical protein
MLDRIASVSTGSQDRLALRLVQVREIAFGEATAGAPMLAHPQIDGIQARRRKT